MSQDNRLNISWSDINRDAALLAWKLDEIRKFKGIIALSRGGLVPAAIIAYQLDIQYIDTYCITSYDHQTQDDCEDLKLPRLFYDMLREDVLVIDDLVDTGHTFEHVKKSLPNCHYAAVYAKPKGKPHCDTFITEVAQHTWIFFPWD